MRRRGARTESALPDPGRSIGVDCRTDGYRHSVAAEMAGRDLAHHGSVIARCGHLVLAGALADLPRPPCPLCYPTTPNT